MQHCPVCGHTPSSSQAHKKSTVVEQILLDAFNLAFEKATSTSSAFVDIEHVLLALTKLPAAAPVFSHHDIDVALLAQVLTLRTEVLAHTANKTNASPVTSKNLRSLLDEAEQFAVARNNNAITVSDIIETLLKHHASSAAVAAIENARAKAPLADSSKPEQFLSTEYFHPSAPAPAASAKQTAFDSEGGAIVPSHSGLDQSGVGELHERLTHLERSMAHQQRELTDLRAEFSNGMSAVLTNVQAQRTFPDNDDRLLQMISATVDRHIETLRVEIRQELSRNAGTTADTMVVDRLNALSTRLETNAKLSNDASNAASTTLRKDALERGTKSGEPSQRHSILDRADANIDTSRANSAHGDEAAHDHLPVFHLEIDDDVVDAPSIGPKTAERLRAARIFTVRDLFETDIEETADIVGARHITPKVLTDWQDQARLVCTIPALRGTHAQLLVGAGYRSASEIRSCDANAICDAVTAFAKTSEGQGLLRQGPPPAKEKILQWVENAHRAQLARVA